MTNADWTKVASFLNLDAAEMAAEKLDGNIPSEIRDPMDGLVTEDYVGACNLWVPNSQVDDANFALAEPAVSDDELTQLALESPPPDDA